MVMFDIFIIEIVCLCFIVFIEWYFNDYVVMLVDLDSICWIGDGQLLDCINVWCLLVMLFGYWQLCGCGMWVFEFKDMGEFIGCVGLMFFEGWLGLELGWMFKFEYCYYGYVIEVGVVVLDFVWYILYV